VVGHVEGTPGGVVDHQVVDRDVQHLGDADDGVE
jgi:hypothetical protein